MSENANRRQRRDTSSRKGYLWYLWRVYTRATSTHRYNEDGKYVKHGGFALTRHGRRMTWSGNRWVKYSDPILDDARRGEPGYGKLGHWEKRNGRWWWPGDVKPKSLRWAVRRFIDGAIADLFILGDMTLAFAVVGMSLLQRIHDFWDGSITWYPHFHNGQIAPDWFAIFYVPLSILVSAQVACGAQTFTRVVAPQRLVYVRLLRWLRRESDEIYFKHGVKKAKRSEWLSPYTAANKFFRWLIHYIVVDLGQSICWTAFAWVEKGYWGLLTWQSLLADVFSGKAGVFLAREFFRVIGVDIERHDQRQLDKDLSNWLALLTPSLAVTIARRVWEKPLVLLSVDHPVWQVAAVIAIQALLAMVVMLVWALRHRKREELARQGR